MVQAVMVTVYYHHKGCGGNLLPQQVGGTYTVDGAKIIKWQPKGTPKVKIPAVFKCDRCNQIGEISHPIDAVDIEKF